MVAVHIGKNIKTLREMMGRKQADVASEIGMSQQDLSKIEKNEFVDDETLEKIADVLGCPIRIFKEANLGGVILTIYQQNGNDGTFNFHSNDKLEGFYEKMLEEKDHLIEKLQKENDELKRKLGMI